MGSRRVLLVWLDGYDPVTGDALMAEGRLPALQRLNAASARFALDHGDARWTGLAGEGIWIGLAAGLAVVSSLMTVRWARRDRLGLTRPVGTRTPPGAV